MIFDKSILLNASWEPADRRDILQKFLSETRLDIVKLGYAIEKDDLVLFARLAHSIKGASLMVGAQELAEVCKIVEHQARAGVPPRAGDVRAAFARLVEYWSESPEEELSDVAK